MDSQQLSVETPPAQAPQRARKGKGWMKKVFDRGRLRTALVLLLCCLAQPTLPGFAAGLALVVVGCALHVWAKGCLRICAEVTTSGPYRWVRNPFYLAALVIEAGYCVAAGVPAAFPVYLLAWYVTYRRTIRREERTLLRLFGARFDTYVAAVPRILPWRGPVRGLPESKPFSWSNPNLAQGREYARVVRILMPPFLFAAVWALRTGALVSGGLVLPMAVLALALLEVVRRAAFRRFKKGLRSLPLFVCTPTARVIAVAAFCAVGGATQFLANDGDRLLVAGVWLVVLAAILALGALPRIAREPALLLLLQAVACSGVGVAAGQPWLAAAFGAWFVLLAIEAAEAPAGLAAQQGPA